MSFIYVPVGADFTEFDSEVFKRTGQIQKMASSVKDTEVSALRTFTYMTHIASLIGQLVQRGFKGGEAAIQAQKALQGVQIATTEVSIANTIIQASALWALHPGQAALLYASAIAMQGNLAALTAQQTNTLQIQQSLQDIRNQQEAWR